MDIKYLVLTETDSEGRKIKIKFSPDGTGMYHSTITREFLYDVANIYAGRTFELTVE